MSSASNNYTGTTTVSNGRLNVNGTHTGGDNYTVANGATIGGGGSIKLASTKSLTLNGTISPGNSTGILTVQNVTADSTVVMPTGGSYVWEINKQTGAEGTNWDTIKLDFVNVTAGTGGFTIRITAAALSLSDWDPNANQPDWVIARSSSSDANKNFTNVPLDKFTINTDDFNNTNLGGFYLRVTNSGRDLDLVYVPEPSSLMATLAIAGGTMLRRRRRSA
jgi:hypothetical protein